MPLEWITAELVARLVATQFPRWAGLPVTAVDTQGWDNRTFRLGDDMSVRLPSAVGYTGAVAKEHAWLPRLAPDLPLPIPAPLAMGAPDDTYPWPWSVRSWLPGRPAAPGVVTDLRRLAEDLGEFLLALQRVDTAGAPAAGEQSSYRGGDLAVYGDETQRSLGALGEQEHAARALWDEATSTTWDRRRCGSTVTWPPGTSSSTAAAVSPQ